MYFALFLLTLNRSCDLESLYTDIIPQAMEDLHPEVGLHLVLITCVTILPMMPSKSTIEKKLNKGQFITDVIFLHEKTTVILKEIYDRLRTLGNDRVDCFMFELNRSEKRCVLG